jgi:predicted phosphoribosyltransferase
MIPTKRCSRWSRGPRLPRRSSSSAHARIDAVPVASPETYENTFVEVDEIVCALMPTVFHGASQWYKDFLQTTNEEVHELLGRTTWCAQPARESRVPQ